MLNWYTHMELINNSMQQHMQALRTSLSSLQRALKQGTLTMTDQRSWAGGCVYGAVFSCP